MIRAPVRCKRLVRLGGARATLGSLSSTIGGKEDATTGQQEPPTPQVGKLCFPDDTIQNIPGKFRNPPQCVQRHFSRAVSQQLID